MSTDAPGTSTSTRDPQRVVVRTTSWVRNAEAARPAPAGSRCASCGYDLTASTSVTCPECGKQLGAVAPEAKRPPLGGFLLLTTAAYSLATVALLVLAAAGLFGALDHYGRIIGVAALVLTMGSALIVRWLVHRPEGYPRSKPRSEITLAWLGLGLPAAMVLGLVVVLVIVLGSVLMHAFFEVGAQVQLRPLVTRVAVGCILFVVIALVRALRRHA